MAADWGRKAASKIDRTQFSKDELLKSLGNQFNVDFTDYDQWTRKNKPVTRPPPPPKGGKSVSIRRTAKSADSCQHGTGPGRGGHIPTLKEKKQAAQKKSLDKERVERVKIIELRIRTRKKTLEEYQKRYHELLEENIKLKADIDEDEMHTMSHVKGLLRRYEKYRGGITTINTNFGTEFENAQGELDATKALTKNKLGSLEKQVSELDEYLKQKQEELHILMNYKDKEYPVKAMKIATLQKDIQNLKISCQEDQEDLEHIIYTELSKYEKERNKNINETTKEMTETAISMMHPSLKDMALQNMVMKKEIEMNKQVQEDLLHDNQLLEAEVERLLKDPKTNTRLQMFPEFFPTREKCTPDMDVILDIPTQEWLPI
ncbi:uncharacterized protein C20orf96-like [Ylistrum balloti]|uniref:uncharacterized protein C20orf96-like n=1 Tax=Ylistrum balloti TaxID=509963 RepID=UPI002905A05C|nr:uncharacterized protein C20orf96-like [Ylistrum balloti]